MFMARRGSLRGRLNAALAHERLIHDHIKSNGQKPAAHHHKMAVHDALHHLGLADKHASRVKHAVERHIEREKARRSSKVGRAIRMLTGGSKLRQRIAKIKKSRESKN